MTTLPTTPFLMRDHDSLDLTRPQLRTLIDRGEVRRVLRGVGVRADVPDSVDLRAQAIHLVLPEHCVVVDHSAAWLHGVRIGPLRAAADPGPLDVAAIEGRRAPERRAAHGCERTLPGLDVADLGGVPVSTPARTAADLACRRGRYDAMATLDAFARSHGVGPVEHAPLLRRFQGRRGVTQYRRLLPLVCAGAESPAESWTRLAIIEEGLPTPEAQVWLDLPGVGPIRLDLAYAGLKIAIEYDGREFHSSAADRRADARRRAALRAAGWVVVVVRSDGFSAQGLARWIDELQVAVSERSPELRRRYARGENAGVVRRRAS